MRRLAILLGSLAAAACVFSRGASVRSHELLQPPPIGLVNAFNMEEQLERGFVPEVLAFLERSGGRGIEETRYARTLGRALLERGDFRAARTMLERAHAKEGRLSGRAEVAWLLAQAAYWEGSFGESARWCRIAQAEGRNVPDGWIAFLLSAGTRRVYEGPDPGARLRTSFTYGRPNLIRVPVRVNGRPPESLILDTGASLSLVTRSVAERMGLETVPDAVASAQGLHDTVLPLRFGWARELALGGVTVRNVPFGILDDDALEFETTITGPMSFPGVLGVHLMKEFDWRIEYTGTQALGVRLDPSARRGSAGQTIFFRRLKPMVRASFNQAPWFLFLLDTGSEPTIVTRSGIQRRGRTTLEASYPMTLEGIGKSRVSWGKLSNATVGVDRFMVRFDDLVVKEENAGIEDGILGSSFLGRFDVEILFGAMRLRLERPLERRLESLRPEALSAGNG